MIFCVSPLSSLLSPDADQKSASECDYYNSLKLKCKYKYVTTLSILNKKQIDKKLNIYMLTLNEIHSMWNSYKMKNKIKCYLTFTWPVDVFVHNKLYLNDIILNLHSSEFLMTLLENLEDKNQFNDHLIDPRRN